MRETLEQIDGERWGEAPADASRLVRTVHELRRRPVGELGVEGLRVLIAQQVGLAVLVPVALEILAADPLAEGDFYPGDLLSAVLRAPRAHWAAHPEQASRLRAVIDGIDAGAAGEEIHAEIDNFRRAWSAR